MNSNRIVGQPVYSDKLIEREAVQVELRRAAIASNLWHACINCAHIRTATSIAPICSIFKQSPPLEVLTIGCDRWMDNDDIPF